MMSVATNLVKEVIAVQVKIHVMKIRGIVILIITVNQG